MKLKYVLFSGLLLSVGFTACTNEEFTEAISPVSTDGIALDGVTINVGNGAGTKAILGDNYKPTWEEGDLLGAARFHTITAYDEEAGVTDVALAFDTDVFSGNYDLALTKGAGTNDGEFTTTNSTGLSAGAFVAYYPQYDDVTPVGKGVLPVAIQSTDIDCAEPLKNVSDNMFAYSAVKFVPDQKAINDYTLKQVPVLYNLYFTPDFHYTQELAEPITIKHIVIEAWKGTTPVTTEAGYIKTVTGAVPTEDDYNNNTLGESIEYVAETNGEVDHLFYTVKNSETNDYQLVNNKVTTVKSFKFSALPWSGEADKVIIKVVTDKGVFAKTYAAGEKNANGVEYLKRFNEQATAEGGVVSLNVNLDTTVEDEVIYTAEQLEDKLANIENGEKYNWILGEPIELPNAELVLDRNTYADITISRYPLTLKNIEMENGKLTINSDLTVKGDVTLGANVEAFSTGTNVISGSDAVLGVEGKLTIGAGKASGNAVALTLSKAGAIQIDRSGIATLTGAADAEVGNINNQGDLTLKSIEIQKGKTLVITEETNPATLTLGDANVVNNGAVVNNGRFDIKNFTFTNNGVFENNDQMIGQGGTFDNKAGAKLYINEDITTWASWYNFKINNAGEDVANSLTAAEINIAEDVKLTAYNNTGVVTNEGVINVNGTLDENSTNALVQNGEKARIYVGENGTIDLADRIGEGYVVVDPAATVQGNGVSSSYIAANIAESADLASIHSKANTLIINAALTVNAAVANQLKSKHLVLYKDLTLATDLTMDQYKLVRVAGDVTVKSNDGTARTLKLATEQNEVLVGAKLTVGENVTLAGKYENSANSKLNVMGQISWEGTQGSNLNVFGNI